MEVSRTPDTLRIDPEFEAVIPPLSEEEFQQLKTNILAENEVFAPIFTWNGVIVDGHHRYKIICQHPEVSYRVYEKEFENRYAALSWICNNQLGRRNLTGRDKEYLIGKRYEAEKLAHGGERKAGERASDQIGHLPDNGRTRRKIAEETHTSEGFVERAEKFSAGVDAAEEVVPGIKREILSGAIKPTKPEVIAIANAQPEEREEMVRDLRLPKEERQERRKQRASIREIQKLSADMKNDDKPEITTAETLAMVELDVDTAIITFELNLARCHAAFTERRYRKQIERIISKLENYINKLRGEQNYG